MDMGEIYNGYIKVSERFAVIYMGLLAEHISYLDSSVSLVSKPRHVNQYLDNSDILKTRDLINEILPA